MRRTKRRFPMLAGAIVAGVLASIVGAAPPAGATVFSNASPITLPDPDCVDPDRATPYPSNIVVGGLSGTLATVSVTLNNVNHPFQGDIEVLLVSPAGGTHNLVVLSDAGTGALSNDTLTFSDSGASVPPQNSPWDAGTHKPVNYTELSGPDTFPSPAPSASSNTTFAGAFAGIAPNGTWSLYVTDDACADAGAISGGWSLDITTAAGAATTTTVSSSLNPSRTGQAVTFTASVRSGGSPVTTGTVTFTRGATTLAANVALNSSGLATFSTSSLVEGDHVITATYNGVPTFNTSNGSVNQRVDNNSVVTGTTYCNTGPVVVNALPTKIATPYPSNIFVTGAPPVLAKVTVTLKNVSHDFPDDIDALLVGPAGQNIEFLSDAGNPGPSPPGASNVTVTFDDAAASTLPQNARWAAPGSTITAKPTNYVDLQADTFPGPAPAVSAATTLSTFQNTNPNGTWSLYVVSDGAPETGSIAGGWCLNLTFSPVASINPTSVAFGPQTVGTQSNPARTVTITNAGGAPLTISGVTVTGAAASDFTVSSNGCTAPVAPTSSCVIGLRFTPGAAGDRQAALVVSDNTTASPHTIALSGTGVGVGTLNVADATPVSENPTTVSFAVSLSSTPATAVTVSYATQHGNAVAGADYTYTGGVLTFAAGATGAALTQTVSVPILEDAVPEGNETFFLQLYNATGPVTLGDAYGQAVILNDDAAPPTVSVSAASPATVLENPSAVSFSVTLSATPTAPVTVHYATNYGSATAGADYTYKEGVLTFAAGATGAALTQSVSVNILEDALAEADETFFLQLYDPSGATLGAQYGLAVIQNDDPAAPTLSIANAPDVAEGNTADQNRTVTFTVTLSATPTGPVTVDFATMGAYFDSTATSQVDYVAREGTLTFAAGTATLTQQIAVDIVEDPLVEPNEKFYVQIYDAAGASLVPTARYGVGTILNDD